MLHELENEPDGARKASTAFSHQDLLLGKGDNKRSVLKTLLKRTHSAPKKINIQKAKAYQLEQVEQAEKSPQQVKCCHPFVDKIKTMADKQLHKKTPKSPKKAKIRTVPVKKENKIVLAEQTQIIRLRESPKAERKNVAAFKEKRDSDEIVEIVELDESPSEVRKRREEYRKADELAKEALISSSDTQLSDSEPTIEELLEEEFKNDPLKKAVRKTKEHIYEEVQPVDDVPAPIQPILVKRNESVSPQKELPESAKTDVTINVGAESTSQIEVTNTEKDNEATKTCAVVVNIDKSSDVIKEPEESNIGSTDFLTPKPKLECTKETASANEKKVTFSQSTEEYQEKLEAERCTDKEDVELPEHLKITTKRWSNMK